jgi:hypothetical protein
MEIKLMTTYSGVSFTLMAGLALSLTACDGDKAKDDGKTAATATSTATGTATATAKADTLALGPGFKKCIEKIEASAIPDTPLAGTYMNTNWKFAGGSVKARGDALSFQLYSTARKGPCSPFPKDKATGIKSPKINASVKGKLEKKSYTYDKKKHGDFYVGFTHYQKGSPHSGNLHGVSVLVIDSVEDKKEGKVKGRAYFCGNKDEGFTAGTFEIANCTVK